MFLADYNDNRQESTATQLEDLLMANVLLTNTYRLDGWTGSASELLFLLTRQRARGWPPRLAVQKRPGS